MEKGRGQGVPLLVIAFTTCPPSPYALSTLSMGLWPCSVFGEAALPYYSSITLLSQRVIH